MSYFHKDDDTYMSIACWDGRTLAVDSRRISTKRGSTTGSNYKKSITDDSVKLTFPTKRILFRKEEIIVIARVGKVRITKLMQDALFDGHEVESYFKKRLEKKTIDARGRGTLLIITAQSAWQFQVNERTGVSIQQVGNQPWAIGVGKSIAVYLMKTLGLSPEHAVSAIIMGHSSCGGDIRMWHRGSRIRTIKDLPTIPDMDSNDRKMRILIDGLRTIDPSNVTTRE